MGEAKSYVIMSELPPDVYRKFVEDKSSSHLTAFTFVVIGTVHLSGGKVTEGMILFFVLLFLRFLIGHISYGVLRLLHLLKESSNLVQV